MNETTEIKRKFYDSLKRGTGEAYVIAKNNPTIDFSNYVIKGALKNFAYDGQSEGSRAQYIFDIISTTQKQTKIKEAIINGLASEQEDTWSLTHLFDLSKLYAQNNNLEFKQAIYDRFLKNPIEGSDWVGYQEILELDGLNGLIHIAEKFGKVVAKNPDDWQDDSIIRHFQGDNPNINAITELENRAKTNKHIRLYLENVERTKNNWKKNRPKAIKFKDIVDEVLKSKHFLSYKRIKELEKSEILEVANQLLKEKNKSTIEKLLWVFRFHRFPFDEEFILSLARQKGNSKNRVKEFAIDALKFLKSENIRTFALERIPKTRNPATFTDILISNYKSGDNKLLTEIANKFNDEHIIESLASSYSDIYTTNSTKECKEPLEILYSKMNCGIHRYGIIQILIDNNVLSDRIREELEFDSYLETRELIKENKKR